MPPTRGNSSFSLLLFGMKVPIMYKRPVRGSTYAKKTQLDPRNALRRWLSEPLTVYIFMACKTSTRESLQNHDIEIEKH